MCCIVVPIVHVPHDTSHAGETQPRGPGVILLVAALASCACPDKEESEDKVEDNEHNDDAGDSLQGHPGDGAGSCALKEALCEEGEGVVV